MFVPQNTPSYLRLRGRTYYFRHRVPADLQQHYTGPEISISLRTRNSRNAIRLADRLFQQLHDEFELIRWRQSQNRFSAYINHNQLINTQSAAPQMTKATEEYLALKGEKRPKNFANSVNRAVGYLLECCGDRSIDRYSREDANTFRDYLQARGLSVSSTKRNISVIRAILNFVAREHELGELNTFASLYFADTDEKPNKRVPFSKEDIQKLQTICLSMKDEARLVLALISDTGMRLSEALGLAVYDIHLEEPIPFVRLQTHKWRRLKTTASERDIPLVGAALTAAKLAIKMADSDVLFPKYCDGVETKSNSASSAINKWIKNNINPKCVVHSLRHTARDRLREVLCPVDVIDSIGGWSRDGIGETYGEGHSLATKSEWLLRIVNQ